MKPRISFAFPTPSRAVRKTSAVVDPFRRRLPTGQKPSFMKVLEADQYGINLQGPGYPEVQYTFVEAHVRGHDTNLPHYRYQPDYRAVTTLETLLHLVGLA